MIFQFTLPDTISVESLNANEVRAEFPPCTINHIYLLLFLMIGYLSKNRPADLFIQLLEEDALPLVKKHMMNFDALKVMKESLEA